MKSDPAQRAGRIRAHTSGSDLDQVFQPKFMLALVLTTLVGTWLIVRFGPEPRVLESAPGIWSEYSQRLISEPSDRLLLIFWLFMGAVMVLSALLAANQGLVRMKRDREHLITWVLFAVLLLVLVTTLITSTEPHDDWTGLTGTSVAGAGLFTVVLAFLTRFTGKPWLGVNLVAAAAAVAFLVGAGWQKHQLVRDPFHFGIALDDFMRGAAWSVPYADYLPTYTALLGHPLGIFRGLAGESQVAVATYWILILQLASVVLAFLIVRQGIDRRNQGIALLLLIAPITFAEIGTGQSALQSAPVIPSRVLLPLLAFLVLVYALKISVATPSDFSIPLAGAGLLLGVAAVNNIEFGATAAAAGLVTAALAAKSRKRAVLMVSAVLVGIGLAFLVFLAMTSFAEHPFDPANPFRIQLTYAAAGFDLHAITTVGPFMPVVITSLLSIFLGTLYLRSATRNDSRFTPGVVLLLMGLWTLLSMGYFTGRSFTSVLFAGLSVQLGVLLAVLADPVWKFCSAKRSDMSGSASTALAALMLIPVFYSLTLLVGSNPPQRVLAFGLSGRPVVETRLEDFDEARSVIADLAAPDADEGLYLIVGPSAVTSKIADMEDGAVMSRFFLQVSKSLTDFQCERLPESGFLIVESPIAEGMKSLSSCQKRLSVVDDGILLGPEVTSTIFRIKKEAG